MRCLYCHERIPPGVNLGNFCRSSHRVAYYQESLRRSGIPKKLVGFQPLNPFADLPVSANAEPNEYPLSPWSLSARHLSTLRSRAIKPLWQYSIRKASSAVAKPKAVNIAIPAARPKHLNCLVTPSDVWVWEIEKPVITSADPVELSAAPWAPASRLFESSRPVPRVPIEHDWRGYLRVELAAARSQGFRQIPEIPLELTWREYKPIERQVNLDSRTFPAHAERNDRLPLQEVTPASRISRWGGFRGRTVEAAMAVPAKLKETPVGFLAGEARLRNLRFDLEATAVQPSPLTAVLYQFDLLAPRPPIREAPGVKKDVPHLRVPAKPTLTTAAGGLLNLQQSGYRISPPQPDLIPSAAQVRGLRLENASSTRPFFSLPECETSTWTDAGTDPFLQLQNRAVRPSPIKIAVAKKDVSYLESSLRVPSTAAMGDVPTIGELRTSGHCELSALPDLIPEAAASTTVHSAVHGEDALPECDTHTWPSLGANEPFLQLQNRSAHPPMVDLLTSKKDVSHLRMLEAPAFVRASPEALALHESVQKKPRLVPDPIPSAVPQNGDREPRLTDGKGSLPDPHMHAVLRPESDGRFSQIQRHMAHPPMVVRPANVEFSRLPELPKTAVSEVWGKLNAEKTGRFTQMRERTVQFPSFGSYAFHFGRLPALLSPGAPGSIPTIIPSVRFKPGETGAAELNVPQRPEIRESHSRPAAKPLLEPGAPELNLLVVLDSKVAPFARSGPEALSAPLSNGNFGAPGGPTPERWSAIPRRERGNVETLSLRWATPLPTGFATLPQPYDHDTTDSAEALRERIFHPIITSHFTLGEVPLSVRRPTLRPMRTTAALDFRFRRTKTVWDRATRWKRNRGSLQILPVSLTTTGFPAQRPV